jgi:predicted flap endonuclease-1-like 5' DNA nuclease
MNLLFRVLYATHAKGTHHKLALDALRYLAPLATEAWSPVFLKHAELLMLGSKAPDDEFKDFANHVLHPRDNFWGGAPVKARSWYGHVVTALKQQDWPTAVYAAGVLSHYVTDPLHPFHTAQSKAENDIHRAVEWSINRAYDALWHMSAELPAPVVTIADADNWLETLVCDGAVEANRHYERLIAHYDFTRGVVDPPAGLDLVAQRLIAELLARAAMTVGNVFQRAIDESGAAAPEISLTLDTVLATLKIPIKTLQKKLADTADRRAVERMYDELQATGHVEANLPEDDRAVRELHAREVLAKVAQFSPAEQFPYQNVKPVETSIERAARLREENRKRALEEAARRVAAQQAARAEARATPPAPAPSQPPAAAPPLPEPEVPSLTSIGPSLVARLDAHERGFTGPAPTLVVSQEKPRKFYLAREHDIVDAPSIGPKTAARLIEAGLVTVGNLLDADPAATAKKLATRHITADTIRDWQDQSRLVIAVPELRGTHAQLIVGAGFRDAASLAAADPADLSARILAFAASSDGQRILRNGDPPDIEAIAAWGLHAQEARAA